MLVLVDPDLVSFKTHFLDLPFLVGVRDMVGSEREDPSELLHQANVINGCGLRTKGVFGLSALSVPGALGGFG